MEDIIYKKALMALKPLLDNNTIREIDLDYGQLDIYDGRPKVAFPCILIDIDFPRTESQDYNGTVQILHAVVTLRIALDVTQESSSITPEPIREKALERFGVNREVYKLMQQYDDGYNSKGFDRTSQQQEKRVDRYKVTVMRFSHTPEDKTASPFV